MQHDHHMKKLAILYFEGKARVSRFLVGIGIQFSNTE